jgi:hypothetical protein
MEFVKQSRPGPVRGWPDKYALERVTLDFIHAQERHQTAHSDFPANH